MTSDAAIVRLVTRDLPGYFLTRAIALRPLRRVTLISPWISLSPNRRLSLAWVIRELSRPRAEIVLVTRPPVARHPWHSEAVEYIGSFPRARVFVHPRLHAKFFIAEGEGADFAVLGSANLTAYGSEGREVGVAIAGRSWGADLIRELLLLGQEIRHESDVVRWRRSSDGPF